MNFENLLFEKEGAIAVLSINRPKALNALNRVTLQELDQALDLINSDEEIQVLIVTGAGERAFVAGADITSMQPMTPTESKIWDGVGQDVFRKLEKLKQPVIAAVNGFALGGGCELAMACDIRVASEKAKFAQPEVGLGIIPGFGGTQRLPRLVGEGKAKELIFTATTIDAAEALRIGLVNHVVPPDQLMGFCKEMAAKIISKAKIAVQYSKMAINDGLQTDIDRGMTIEVDLFALCFATEDQKEAMAAFIEKRPARLTGK